jgi:hypothetical protein
MTLPIHPVSTRAGDIKLPGVIITPPCLTHIISISHHLSLIMALCFFFFPAPSRLLRMNRLAWIRPRPRAGKAHAGRSSVTGIIRPKKSLFFFLFLYIASCWGISSRRALVGSESGHRPFTKRLARTPHQGAVVRGISSCEALPVRYGAGTRASSALIHSGGFPKPESYRRSFFCLY